MNAIATLERAADAIAGIRRHPAIRLVDVNKIYRTDRIETVALDGVNLTVEPGEFISIMGPSGSGKSTLLHLVGLLDRPSTGTLEITGRPVMGLNDRALARLRNETIGFVFQTFHLVNDLNVVDNVEIPLLYRKMSGSDRRRRAMEALARVGLSARTHHHPGQLSGGQRQRVAIARAIAAEPRILLADEPTGNLDSQMGDEIMAILESLNREQGTTVVMVTHDQRLAERTRRTIRLFDGRQVQ
ncbi:MAG TPA: ABC transporter ATP-binding protein [Candidatus Eisenbacteria bacterium]